MPGLGGELGKVERCLLVGYVARSEGWCSGRGGGCDGVGVAEGGFGAALCVNAGKC